MRLRTSIGTAIGAGALLAGLALATDRHSAIDQRRAAHTRRGTNHA